MAAKGPPKGDFEITLDDALLRVVSNFENLHDLSKQQALFSLPISPILLVVSPLNALIDDQIRSCEVFGLTCVKLEEFKEGNSVNLLFSSPETLLRFIKSERKYFWRRY